MKQFDVGARGLAVCALLMLTVSAYGSDVRITQEIQAAKQQALQLNKELYELEQALLTPITTQAALFFSIQPVDQFAPLSIDIQLGNLAPIHHLYSEREVQALRMGAVQPLANSHLAPGKHDVQVRINGVNVRGQTQQLTANATIEKGEGPLYLEVHVGGASGQPVQANIRTW